MFKFAVRTAVGGALVLLMPWTSASAVTFTATASTIASTFYGASSGDTITLTGNFGLTRLQNMTFASGITLDARQAVFTDTLELVRLNGVRVLGGKFDVSSGHSHDSRGAAVWGGSNITFDQPTIIGGSNQGGIGFVDVSNVRVSGGSFTGLYFGINLSRVTGAVLTKNQFLKTYSDGIDIGDSHYVSATYNTCSGSAPGPRVHPDCIQMWSVKGRPLQSDNIVSDNSATGSTQGFTSFSGGGGGIRLSILRNTANTSYTQGIACYGCIDSDVSYNKVTTLPGSAHMTNIHVVGGANNTVVGNTIGGMPFSYGSSRETGGQLADELPVSSAVPAMSDIPRHEASLGFSPSTVTEPGTWALLVAGFGFVGLAVRRRKLPALAA